MDPAAADFTAYPNQFAEFVVGAIGSGGYAGVVLRYQNGVGGYVFEYDESDVNGNAYFGKTTSDGGWSGGIQGFSLSTGRVHVGDVMRAEISGAVLTVKVNGVVAFVSNPDPDNLFTAGQPGLWAYSSTDLAFDNFAAGVL